jgi:hypothetical protein
VRNRVEPQHRALRPQVEVDEPDPQRHSVPGRRLQHPDVGRVDPGRRSLVGTVPWGAQADEVGIRVQDQHGQAGPEK